MHDSTSPGRNSALHAATESREVSASAKAKRRIDSTPAPRLSEVSAKTLDRIIRMPELVEITGLSSASVYRLIGQGRFPRPVVLGRQARGWVESHVRRWFEGLQPTEATSGPDAKEV